MYVEKDINGKIIIQDISPSDAEILDDCLCSYLSGQRLGKERSEAEKIIAKLKIEIEKLY